MDFGFVRRHPGWTWIALVLVLMSVLVLVFLPRFIQQGLESWLERQGPISVEIEDVDFNPFTGRLVIETLLAQREETPGRVTWERASITAEWWPLTRRRLMLDRIAVRDAVVTVRVADGTVYVGGLKIRPGAEEPERESAWSFGFGDIDLRNTVLIYIEGEIRKEVLVEEAHLDSMQQWNPEDKGEVRLRLRAAGAPITLEGTANPFAAHPEAEGRLEISGFPLAWLAPWWERAGIDLRQGELSAGFDLRTRLLPEDGRVRLAADGRVSLGALRGRLAEIAIEEAALSWEGRLEVAAPREGKPPLVVVDGRASSPGMTFFLQEPAIRATVGELSVEEEFAMGTDAVPAEAEFLLRLAGSAGPLQAFDAEKELTMADLKRLEITGLRLAGAERIEAGRIEAAALRLLQRSEAAAKEPSHFLEVARVVVEKIEGSPSGPLAAAVMRLQGVRAVVTRNEQGEVAFSPWSPPPAGGEEGGDDPEEPSPSPLPAIRIDRLEIDGDNRLRFLDRSVEPAVRVTVAPLRARVTGLDTAATPDAPPARFDVRLQADGHPLALAGTARPFGREVTVESRLEAKGWPLPLFTPYFGPNVEVRQGKVTIDGRFDGRYTPDTADGGSRFALDGAVRLAGLDGTFGGVTLAGRAAWNGEISVASGPSEEPPQVEAAGSLQIPEVAALLHEQSLRLQAREVQLEGKFAMGAPRVPASADFLLTISGGTGELRVLEANSGLESFAAAAVEADQLRLAGSTISAVGVNLRAPRALERPEPPAEEPSHLVSAESLRLAGLRRGGPTDLQVREMQVSALQAIVVRDEQGEFEFGPWGEDGDADGEPAPAETGRRPEQEKTLRLRAESIRVDGGSRLLFHDRSVDPAVRLQLNSVTARVEDLDTAAGTPAPLRIGGNFGQYAPLEIEGRVTTLGTAPTIDLSTDLQDFSLLEVAGYIERYLGYTVRSGQLDLQIEGKVVRGEIEAGATAVLTQLDLEPLTTEARQETERKLGLPLEKGLSLLRDRQGTIRVEVPISGDIGSPDFGIANILQTAFLNALRRAALSYFANLGATTLGAPVGAALLAKRFVFDRLTAVRFRPVYFPPGMAVLTDGSRDYLQEVAEKLADRPEINIVLCGVAVPEDAAILPPAAGEDDLLRLARTRADAVRDALVALGIPPGRLVQCAPEVLDQKEGAPRVEIGI